MLERMKRDIEETTERFADRMRELLESGNGKEKSGDK